MVLVEQPLIIMKFWAPHNILVTKYNTNVHFMKLQNNQVWDRFELKNKVGPGHFEKVLWNEDIAYKWLFQMVSDHQFYNPISVIWNVLQNLVS